MKTYLHQYTYFSIYFMFLPTIYAYPVFSIQYTINIKIFIEYIPNIDLYKFTV